MRNILILITLISGLIFVSLIKNKTRLLEKELTSLNDEITTLNSNLAEANLDFQYLTTPERISLLAKDFLDENFSYYNESQIKESFKPEKDSTILKKSKNDNTPSQLDTEKLANKKSNIAKEIDRKQLFITKKIDTQITEDAFTGEETVKYLAILKKSKNDNILSQVDTEKSVNKKLNITKEIDSRQLQGSKKKTVSKKVQDWMGIQIVKSLLGITAIPVK